MAFCGGGKAARKYRGVRSRMGDKAELQQRSQMVKNFSGTLEIQFTNFNDFLNHLRGRAALSRALPTFLPVPPPSVASDGPDGTSPRRTTTNTLELF
jgi:hypothetical protein